MSKLSYFMSAIPTLHCFDFKGEEWEVWGARPFFECLVLSKDGIHKLMIVTAEMRMSDRSEQAREK